MARMVHSNLTLPPPSFTCRMSMSDRAAQRWSLFTAPISNLMVSVPLARCGTPWERTYDSCRQHVQGSVHAEQCEIIRYLCRMRSKPSIWPSINLETQSRYRFLRFLDAIAKAHHHPNLKWLCNSFAKQLQVKLSLPNYQTKQLQLCVNMFVVLCCPI